MLEALRPELQRHETYDEAAAAVAQLLAEEQAAAAARVGLPPVEEEDSDDDDAPPADGEEGAGFGTSRFLSKPSQKHSHSMSVGLPCHAK